MSLLHRAIPWLALFLLVLMTIDPAMAQAFGGGGGGGSLMAIVQWIVTNVATPLIGFGVIVAGFYLIMGHHTMAGIATMAVGAFVLSQWQTIAGLFGVG